MGEGRSVFLYPFHEGPRSDCSRFTLGTRLPIDRLNHMPSETPFRDVEKLLNQAGYELVRINGSHHVFTKAGRQPVSIPVHRGKVNPFYVRQIERLRDE